MCYSIAIYYTVYHGQTCKDQFSPPASSSAEASELSTIEENALRYISGYIIRAARKSIAGKHAKEEVLLDGLDEMCTAHSDEESNAWVNAVDIYKGGLIHVTHNAFMVFYSIEMVIRTHFTDSNSTAAVVEEATQKDIDVLYYWNICHEYMDRTEREELLKLVVIKYVTLRGHSFASS